MAFTVTTKSENPLAICAAMALTGVGRGVIFVAKCTGILALAYLFGLARAAKPLAASAAVMGVEANKNLRK